MRPAVTVVVASYNHERFVTGALDSVKGQTHPAVQLIVTDDASSDASRDKIRSWARNNDVSARFVFNEKNLGICPTFNRALALVETPYYTVMAADDEMLPPRLAAQVALLEGEPGSVACYSNAALMDDSGTTLDRSFKDEYRFAGRSWPSGNIFEELCRGNWIPAPSVLLRTAAVRAVGGYDERWRVEDYSLWLRLAARGRFEVVDDCLVRYRLHDASMTVSMSRERQIGDQLSATRLTVLGVSEEGDDIILDEALARFGHHYLSGNNSPLVAESLATVRDRVRSPYARTLAWGAANRIPSVLVKPLARVLRSLG